MREEYLKEWSKPREDMECDDLKVKCRVYFRGTASNIYLKVSWEIEKLKKIYIYKNSFNQVFHWTE